MKLYDFPQSPNCRKVRMYLAEKGLSVPLQQINLLAGEQSSPEFLRRNPFGAVPILELDDGTVIPESLVIIEYFEELYPEPPLLGRDPLTRTLVRAWERRCELGVFLQATRRFLHSSPFFAARVEQNPKVVEEIYLGVLNRPPTEKELATVDFSTGSRLEVAQDLTWALMNSPAFLFNR